MTEDQHRIISAGMEAIRRGHAAPAVTAKVLSVLADDENIADRVPTKVMRRLVNRLAHGAATAGSLVGGLTCAFEEALDDLAKPEGEGSTPTDDAAMQAVIASEVNDPEFSGLLDRILTPKANDHFTWPGHAKDTP